MTTLCPLKQTEPGQQTIPGALESGCNNLVLRNSCASMHIDYLPRTALWEDVSQNKEQWASCSSSTYSNFGVVVPQLWDPVPQILELGLFDKLKFVALSLSMSLSKCWSFFLSGYCRIRAIGKLKDALNCEHRSWITCFGHQSQIARSNHYFNISE